MTAELGVIVEARRGPLDLIEVLDHGLAALARHRLGQVPMHRSYASGHFVQHLRLVEPWNAPPLPLRDVGTLHRRRHVSRLRTRHETNRLLSRRVLDGHRLTIARALVAV